MTITDATIAQQVGTAISANGSELAEGIDIEGITRAIIVRHGLVDIDTIPSDEFWALVEQYDGSQQ